MRRLRFVGIVFVRFLKTKLEGDRDDIARQ